MRFIGVDLAWSTKNKTGAAIIEGDETVGRLVETALLRTDDEVIEFILRHSGDDPAIVAIDAPLVVPNETGQRPAEAEIGPVFGRYQASAHSANRARVSVGGVVRGEVIVERLQQHGFEHKPEVEKLRPVRQVVEVYPHPAIVSIFRLDRIVKYKAKPSRTYEESLRELDRYRDLLRSLKTGEPALVDTEELLGKDVRSLIKARVKDYEDLLDALMCAYIAYYLWRWNMERARVFGNLAAGYITTPVPRALWSSSETERPAQHSASPPATVIAEAIAIPAITLAWSEWIPWQQFALDQRLQGGVSVPSKPGVYEVKYAASEEWLHIGRASSLYGRVKGGLVKGKVPHSTGERIRAAEDVSRLVVRWAITDRPAAVEEELHRRHRAKFGKLPKYSKVT